MNECRIRENDERANSAQEVEDDGNHALLIVTKVGESSNYHTWFLNTGCTNHMSEQNELFVDLD